MSEDKHISVDRALQTLGGILLAICLALAGWGLKTAAGNSERLTAIEASRFTIQDGAGIAEVMSDIKTKLAVVESSVQATGKQMDNLTKEVKRLADKPSK